jgi:hypothetical protein
MGLVSPAGGRAAWRTDGRTAMPLAVRWALGVPRQCPGRRRLTSCGSLGGEALLENKRNGCVSYSKAIGCSDHDPLTSIVNIPSYPRCRLRRHGCASRSRFRHLNLEGEVEIEIAGLEIDMSLKNQTLACTIKIQVQPSKI